MKLRYIFKLRKKTKKKIRRLLLKLKTKLFPSTIDRSRSWNDVPPFEQDWFNDGTYKCCLTCKSGQWMVAIGQGFRCSNPEKVKTGTHPKLWPIPHRQYICEFYKKPGTK